MRKLLFYCLFALGSFSQQVSANCDDVQDSYAEIAKKPKRLAAKNEVIARNHNRYLYEEWGAGVFVKTLIDNSITATHKITMSLARIFTELFEHQHAATEIYYIVSGTGKMILDGEEILLEPGKMIYLPKGITHHTFVEEGADPVEFLYIFAKSGLEDVSYIKDGSVARSAETPIDMMIHKPEGTNYFVKELVNRTESDEEGLRFLQAFLSKGRSHTVDADPSPSTIFIESGEGFVNVNGKLIYVKKGSYLYIPENTAFSIVGTNDLHSFVFATNPPVDTL